MSWPSWPEALAAEGWARGLFGAPCRVTSCCPGCWPIEWARSHQSVM